jgi:hypothetical protein
VNSIEQINHAGREREAFVAPQQTVGCGLRWLGVLIIGVDDKRV